MVEVMVAAADKGAFSAYLGPPQGRARKRPGIVMMPQIFGVNKEMRGIAARYATQGSVAICPDQRWTNFPPPGVFPTLAITAGGRWEGQCFAD